MKLELAASQLAELGHVTRLGVYRILVKAGSGGQPVSSLQEQLQVPGSTLSHHINKLVQVGLVKQVREGRVLRCFAQFDKLDRLIDFLLEECCSQQSD
ncbi:MAG: helix-turn-helix domain-containing protein [Pseudomonadales bacterium]|nr:helix-turn-helix domain-containing protein [Pseudomonadales bacterium]NRA15367.1 helix-turn-helix transcriptional regulator [Oceanospirillaceae bacterium]